MAWTPIRPSRLMAPGIPTARTSPGSRRGRIWTYTARTALETAFPSRAATTTSALSTPCARPRARPAPTKRLTSRIARSLTSTALSSRTSTRRTAPTSSRVPRPSRTVPSRTAMRGPLGLRGRKSRTKLRLRRVVPAKVAPTRVAPARRAPRAVSLTTPTQLLPHRPYPCRPRRK